MMLLRYAPAEPEDIDAIFAMSKDLVACYEDLTAIDYSKVTAWLHRKIEKNIRLYTCVWQNGKKVAYYGLERKDGQTELDDFYVLPEFRSRGIGSEILKKCCEDATEPLFLYVFTANHGAIRLYLRHGVVATEQVSPTRIIMTRRT